ncbi:MULTISPECIES: hypothetical protein [Klebsiella]|uniref:Uncharacterized protein n=1 Tax=Klebsiella pasteurii TaxID=2587529 RepID=A0ABT5CX22_9ENTR|nr:MULTISPECIES: hypothetical protein [Klebsiella]MBG2719552.1 hypothetical protein [Klebsiella michiganensis]MDC0695248.1 hypothetical protein [Klebsiella pasteurii]MDM4218038.1 hypothetical protein [Klebsiella pasteurii]MDS7877264.1 hypothetical protein [Klebsiella pasteurii]MDV1072609.1 hypothetical protein [Klebsiella pasteurii]
MEVLAIAWGAKGTASSNVRLSKETRNLVIVNILKSIFARYERTPRRWGDDAAGKNHHTLSERELANKNREQMLHCRHKNLFMPAMS